MSVKKNLDKIEYWYNILEDFECASISLKLYCKRNNLDRQQFTRMRNRIVYKRESNPELYAKLLQIGKEYLKSGSKGGPENFAKAHEIKIQDLKDIATHIRYLDIIEEIKKEKEIEPMKFVQVPQRLVSEQRIQVPQGEIIEKQNDIEIMIAKGVKVSISPNIDSMKIIKIIELLKDL